VSSRTSGRWRRTTRVSSRAARRAPVAGVRARLFDRFADVFHTAATHAFILNRCCNWSSERHAKFNGTL
jgi:hypothetical protein